MANHTSDPRSLSRRQFLRNSAMFAGAALLVACAPPTTADQTTTDTGSDAAEPTPTPNISSIGTGETEVIFWHGLGGADGKTMTELLQVYADEHPEISVQQELLTWDIFYQKVPTSVIAGNPPDMIITHEWAVGQFGARDMLRPADEFYEMRGLPKDDFIEFAFKNVNYEGTPLGVLLDNHGQGLYYNVELFEEAGLDPDSPPQTPTEFLEQATLLTKDANGNHPGDSGFDPDNIEQWGFTWTFWQRWAMLSTIWQNGGDTLTEDGTKSLLDQDATRDALQFWHDLIHTHNVMALPFGWDRADAYTNNRLAMYVNGSWDLNFIRDTGLEEKTRAAYAPQVTGIQPNVWMSAHVMAIPNGVEEERTGPAGDLITWLSEHGLEWANSGQPPARLSQQNSEELQSHWHTGVFSRQFQEIGRTEIPHINITEIQEAYQPEFEAALTDQKSIDEAVATAHERVQSILDREA